MAKSKESDLIKWYPDVEDHDYPDAESYLSLIYQPDQVASLVAQLRAAALVQFKAKDIFRASGLSSLGVSNERVERNREKIRKGIELSPLLLVRDEPHGKVVIADGYHRLCAIYGYDEDAWIPCKIV